MFEQTRLRSATLAAALTGLAIYAWTGGYFAREIVIEIAILSILAVSLDLVAGFGGLVSMFHAALMGVAAYGFGVMTAKLGYPAIPSALAGIVITTVFGTLVAAVTSRTSGIFFIMATLAFGQLAYTLIFRSRWLGGDDGMAGMPRFDAGWLGVNLGNSLHFALFALVLVLLCYLLAALVLRSGFGRMLSGLHSNEPRLKALGVTTWWVKTRAFAISSALAGMAGILAAQHSQYISPELLSWTYSGEVLIVVILGGLGTLTGPLLGAILYVLMKHRIEDFTVHWHLIIGLVLIATVLSGGRGFYGQAEYWLHRRYPGRGDA